MEWNGMSWIRGLQDAPSLHNTVNSLYSGHCRDLELVSSLARVCKSGSLFQSNISNIFLQGI